MLKFTRDPLSLTLALSLSPSHPHTLSLSLAVTSESKGYKQFEDELSPPTRQSWSSESKDGSGYLPPTSSPTSDCDDRKMAAIDVVLDSGSVDLEQEAADLELALKMQTNAVAPVTKQLLSRSNIHLPVSQRDAPTKPASSGALSSIDEIKSGYQMMPISSAAALPKPSTPVDRQEYDDRLLALKLHELELERCKVQKSVESAHQQAKADNMRLGRSTLRR